MPEFTLTDGDEPREIDLGNSKGLNVLVERGNDAEIYIEYNVRGKMTSAIKASAGFGNGFSLDLRQSKWVPKDDLATEHVFVGVKGDGVRVTFSY